MKLENNQEIKIDGELLKVVIVLPYFNEIIGTELLDNANQELLANNVQPENIEIVRTSGALEIPYACKKIIQDKNPDIIIALGVIIRGETTHYDLVSENTYRGIMKVQLETGTPISFGIISCENEAQAKERASKDGLNKGKDAAQAALLQTII